MGAGAVTTGGGPAGDAELKPGAGGESGGAVADPNQPGGAGAGGGGEGEGAGDELATFKEGLDPVLQNMDAEQINDLFNTMSSAVRAAGSAPAPAVVAAPEPKPEPTPEPKTSTELREMFDPSSESYNPEDAVAQINLRNYGPLIDSISNNAISGMFAAFEKEVPDFDDFRPQIEESLKGIPQVQWNAGVVSQLYLQAKGAKTLQNERAEAEKAKGAKTLTPSPASVEDEAAKTRAELPEIEKQTAIKMFPRHSDPVGQYIKRLEEYDSGHRTVDVPLGGGKKG